MGRGRRVPTTRSKAESHAVAYIDAAKVVGYVDADKVGVAVEQAPLPGARVHQSKRPVKPSDLLPARE